MSYLQCSDDETVDSANKVSRFSYESQCEVKQGVTGGQSSTLSNDDTLPGTYFVSHTLTWDINVWVFSNSNISAHLVVKKGVNFCFIFAFSPDSWYYDWVKMRKGNSAILLVFSFYLCITQIFVRKKRL